MDLTPYISNSEISVSTMSPINKIDALLIIYIAIALFYTFVISWDIVLYIKNRNLLSRHRKRLGRFLDTGNILIELRRRRMAESERLTIVRNHEALNAGLKQIVQDDPSEDLLLLFLSSFSKAYPAFISTINSIIPGLTSHEVRLCILIRLNVTSKEIARILNVTAESVNKARYRLRKKIGLHRHQDLFQLLVSI